MYTDKAGEKVNQSTGGVPKSDVEMMNMEKSEIQEIIDGFPHWHYEFNLKGIKTPIFRRDHVNRHRQRKRYFFDKLVHLCGGTLKGKRILDLGCNAGYWSLEAINNGADYVLCIDGRKMLIDQANFVFKVLEIDKKRYNFVFGNLFDIDFKALGKFDVCLCLGLMYHINKPVLLMEKLSEVNTDLLLIDTSLSKYPKSVFEIRYDSLNDPRHSVDYELVFLPTKHAIIELTRQFGYHTVILKPHFTDYEGVRDYQTGERRAFLCSKKRILEKALNKIDLEKSNKFSPREIIRTFCYKLRILLGV